MTNDIHQETAFIYCRVSTENQDTSRQVRDLEEFAIKNNLNVLRVYEETISGTKSINARRSMLKEVAKLKPKYFIIGDYGRFSRNVKTALQMKDALHELDVCVWSMQTNLKSLNEDGSPSPTANMIFTNLLSVYEFENEQRRAHIKSGLANAKAKGIVLGRPHGSYKTNRLTLYKKTVGAIQEQEELKQQGKKHLSIRKLAVYTGKHKSLIQSLKAEMVETGLIQSSKMRVV